jgi:hypothetical protein
VKFELENKEGKRHYEKPMLRIIELAADEILAVGCKTPSSGNTGGVTCSSNGCAAYGS